MQDVPLLTLWPWGLLIGLAFGATLQRSHFCTMGCVSDAVLFGSLRRLRVWALAIAIAASCEFTTPVGYQTNLMVFGPGGYRFSDYIRYGLIPTFIYMAMTIFGIAWWYNML